MADAPALCDVQDADEACIARGLRDVFGFRQVHNVWPDLHAGSPVLLFGWRDFYCEAIGRFPGKPVVLWRRGWAETDADAQGSRLATVLRHTRAGSIRLLWGDVGDHAPAGAVLLPPVWRELSAPDPRPGTGHAVCAGGGLACVRAALAAGAKVHLPRAAVIPSTRDLSPGVHERAEALRSLVAGTPHVLYDGDAPLAVADLLIEAPRGSWSWPALAAIRAGVPVLTSASVVWAGLLPDEIAEACVAQPDTSSTLMAEMVQTLLADADLRRAVLHAQARAVESLRAPFTAAAADALRACGFPVETPPPPPPRPRVVLYSDTPGWAQGIFVRDLARQARAWGWDAEQGESPRGAAFYSPCFGAADRVRDMGDASTGLWSHVSYGGWFTDDPLDPARLPKVRAHATNLYLHDLTDLPYLAAGVDTDLFCPPVGPEDRRARRKRRDRRIVIGWTGSLGFNAALKLFHDLWVPATRRAGTDGPLAEARFCARPLVVWDHRDARDPRAVAEYLRGIDVYLCTSISEGCSLSVLEAAAAGCAIVSTPCGNAPELASEIVGWDAEKIAAVLRRYADNPDQIDEDGARARQIVMRYWSWGSPAKAEAWKAWLAGGDVPSWREQLPYLARNGVEPAALLAASRTLREAAVPALRRGDMHAS